MLTQAGRIKAYESQRNGGMPTPAQGRRVHKWYNRTKCPTCFAGGVWPCLTTSGNGAKKSHANRRIVK